MSVIVKGMEMPKRCFECPIIDATDGFWCSAADKDLRKEHGINLSKPVWCPLRPLPKRHGRLIEAERLRAEFPYPREGMGGWRNPDEALIHKTGVWAAIDCAETIVESEGDY